MAAYARQHGPLDFILGLGTCVRLLATCQHYYFLFVCLFVCLDLCVSIHPYISVRSLHHFVMHHIPHIRIVYARVWSSIFFSLHALPGDNFYPNGVRSVDDPKFQTTWARPFLAHRELCVPWRMILGNHDYVSKGGRNLFSYDVLLF